MQREPIATFARLLPVLCLIASGQAATYPGAKIRVTQSGLNYAAAEAVISLSAAIKRIKIPDFDGKAHVIVGNVEYHVTNIKVTAFSPPATAISAGGAAGLTVSAVNAAVHLTGDWRYKYKAAFIPIKGHGTFDADSSGIDASLAMKFALNASTRHATVASTACTALVSRLKIRVHGGASWFYNLFMKTVAKHVRGHVELLLCVEARKAVDRDAAGLLAKLPTQVTLLRDWLVDLRLLDAPLLTPGYIEVPLKAEVFTAGDRSEAPFEPADLPNPPSTPGMVALWLSDYTLNTAFYTLYRHSVLARNLTARDLPAPYQGYLDVTCRTTPVCIGKVVPAIQKLYPNATVELKLGASIPPKAEITTTGINGVLNVVIAYRARLVNGSSAYLFSTDVKMDSTLMLQMNRTIVSATLIKLSPTVGVIDSAVGPISNATLTAVFGMVAKVAVIPKLNEIGRKGFALPTLPHLTLVNAALGLEDHALRITTDLRYTPYYDVTPTDRENYEEEGMDKASDEDRYEDRDEDKVEERDENRDEDRYEDGDEDRDENRDEDRDEDIYEDIYEGGDEYKDEDRDKDMEEVDDEDRDEHNIYFRSFLDVSQKGAGEDANGNL